MMNNGNSNDLLKRKLLYNVCSNGHEQPVHHRYCSICGKLITRIFTEHSWQDMRFDAREAFTCLHESNKSLPSKAFISLFDNNLLVVFENRQCLFVREMHLNGDNNQKVSEFTINSLTGLIENLVTDHRYIYIQNEHKLYLLDWVDLLNSQPEIIQINGTNGKNSGIAYHENVYFYTESILQKFNGPEAKNIVNPDASDTIHMVDTYQKHIFLVGEKQTGELFLRANDFHDPDSIAQEVTICFNGEMKDMVSAIGKEYYAFSPDRQKIFVGRINGLRTTQKYIYSWDIDGCINRMFFLQNYLYVNDGNALSRWDMQNFTTHADAQNHSVNLNSLQHSVNIDSSEICVPIMQGSNDYISIMNPSLMQQSLSPGLPEQLIALATYNNHVFAITSSPNSTKIYIG